MLNQVVLVGRLVKDPELVETESNKKMTHITIAIPRSFKNVNGEYESDFINCVLWDAVAKSTVDYCHKGDIVGVKGRIQSRMVEENKEKKYYFDVVAERVTFLSSNKKEKADE
jgi:single-strand DNA-binding protein